MAAPDQPKRARWAIWVVALVPFVPMLAAVLAFQVPASDEVTRLVGNWWGAPAAAGVDPFGPLDERWKPLKLPGSFQTQGVVGEHLWLRRTFTAPDAMAGEDASFVVGNVRGAALRVWVNGELVGAKGEARRQFLGFSDGSDAHFVPGRLVRRGENAIALEVQSFPSGRDGLTDPRLLFGRRDVLGPWHFNEQQTRTTFEQGSLVLLAFLTVLIVVMWRSQRRTADGRLYASTLALFAASALYLIGKNGVFISGFVPASWQLKLIPLAVGLLGATLPLFLQLYFLSRLNWATWVNVAVSAVAVLAIVFGVPPYQVLRVFSAWLFVSIVWCVGMASWALVKRVARYGPLAATASYSMALAATSDLLGDLDLIFAPRLFTYTVADMSIMAGAILVAEFLELSRENSRLSTSLRTRNEELAAALERAQEASRVKSECLANTSHELRTPLNAIINIPQGLVEQLESHARLRCAACGALFEVDPGEAAAPGPCPDCAAPLAVVHAGHELVRTGEATRLLKSVVLSGNHLLSVVNDILDYSKLEAARVQLHREALTAGPLLAEVVDALGPLARSAGVQLDARSEGEALEFEADRLKLKQVLLNLVANAIKFSDGKGQVTVRARAVPAGVAFSVRDEGIGISPENQALIFEGFRQVEGGNTRRFGGTGLGLAISSKLVALHGGTLRVESALGQGSTFTVTLPLKGAR